MEQLSLIPTARPGSAFDERGVGRYHDVDLMATTAIRLHNKGDHDAAALAILLPGVLDRVVELTHEGGYVLDAPTAD